MDIHLTPEFERLDLLERRKGAIRTKIDEGWESLQHGEGLDGEATIAELEAELDHKCASIGRD